MLINNIVAEQKLLRARVQPHLWFLPFSLKLTLEEIQARHFPYLTKPIEFYAVAQGPLACICFFEERATIFIHQVLNHSETPSEVINFIYKHELLHLQIKGMEVNGKMTAHPPEFWEAEKRIAPERTVAWNWIWINLGLCLKRRPKQERIDVLPGWRKIWALPKMGLEDAMAMCLNVEPEEDGW